MSSASWPSSAHAHAQLPGDVTKADRARAIEVAALAVEYDASGQQDLLVLNGVLQGLGDVAL
ncbi:hypothetical protein ACWEQ2_02430 [Streptomyces sp. NPDC004096]